MFFLIFWDGNGKIKVTSILALDVVRDENQARAGIEHFLFRLILVPKHEKPHQNNLRQELFSSSS